MRRVKNPERARRIVKLAAKGLTVSEAKSWLKRDERGTWELYADELIARAAENPLAATMTEAQVDDEIATLLALAAITTVLKAEEKRAL